MVGVVNLQRPWRRLFLVLTLTATLVRASNVTEMETDDSAEDVGVGDEDFPDDEPQAPHAAHAPPSPVSVYVLRLLEILLGAESLGKHTRYSRAVGDGDGYSARQDEPQSGRASAVSTAASYSNYYDFLINEGSYKFWAAFQIGTAVLLVYSAFAALYYARYTYYTNVDYTDYGDYFFRRSGTSRSQRSAEPFKGLAASEYQRVMDAVDGAKFKLSQPPNRSTS